MNPIFRNYFPWTNDACNIRWSDRLIWRGIVAASLLGMMYFLGGAWIAGSCFMLGSLLFKIGLRILPPEDHWYGKRMLIYVAALAIFLSTCVCSVWHKKQQAPQIIWQDLSLQAMLPTPLNPQGRVQQDQKDVLSAELYFRSRGRVAQYRDDCIAYGFETREEDSHQWIGTDENGWVLTLNYNPREDIMALRLEKPETKPVSDDLLPVFSMIPMTEDGWEAYIRKQQSEGWDRNVRQGAYWFQAENQEGERIQAEFSGSFCMITTEKRLIPLIP